MDLEEIIEQLEKATQIALDINISEKATLTFAKSETNDFYVIQERVSIKDIGKYLKARIAIQSSLENDKIK